jgi:cell wall-associated NlpC family hydrolase
MRTRLSKSKSILRTTVVFALLVSLAGIVVATDSHNAGAVTQQQAIVNAAQSQVQANVPYCEGGGTINGPSGGGACAPGIKGFDCMTLALYAVYQGTGVTIPANPSTGPGTFVPPDGLNTSNLQPGDAVFFGGKSSNDPVLSQYTHSGIYAGDNEVYDALAAGDNVAEHTFASIYSDYGNVYDGAIQYWTGGTAPSFGITTTSPLPKGSVYSKTNKVSYSDTLRAQGGNPPYSWTLTKGSKLPPGLRLKKKTGVISGKAKTTGTYSFTVQVADTKTKTKPPTQNKATSTFSITINS